MRPVRPAESSRAGYPRLARAWRILVAAPIALLPQLALGDATLPHDGNNKGPGDQKKPEPPPPPQVNYPILGGAMAAPDPPEPPAKKKKKEEKEKPKVVGMVVHPHGPDEPCRRIA